MEPNILILAGTKEAVKLSERIREAKIKAVLSFAGRVKRTKPTSLPKRLGGFGGVLGMCDYIVQKQITHVVDATHPFSVQISQNAVDACLQTKTPLLALTRPAWFQKDHDDWICVPNFRAAAQALSGPAKNVMLAIGRTKLEVFFCQPQHHYLLRFVDPPQEPIAFPRKSVVISRGPYTGKEDKELLKKYEVEVVVSKNSGGAGAQSKINAARELGIPIIMIDRPILERERKETFFIDNVFNWLLHETNDRGV